MIVIETESHAKDRGATVLAELAGYGSTDDAFHITQPSEGGIGALKAMDRAVIDANLNPEDIDYINAHGTSTPFNDKNESAAIKQLFKDHSKKLKVSSSSAVKTVASNFLTVWLSLQQKKSANERRFLLVMSPSRSGSSPFRTRCSPTSRSISGAPSASPSYRPCKSSPRPNARRCCSRRSSAGARPKSPTCSTPRRRR